MPRGKSETLQKPKDGMRCGEDVRKKVMQATENGKRRRTKGEERAEGKTGKKERKDG